MKRKSITLFFVVSLMLLNMPCIISQGDGSMNSVTVEYDDNGYTIYYDELLFSKGDGIVSNVQYETNGAEVFITYQADTPRLAWSPDGEGFIDMEAYVTGSPIEVGNYMRTVSPENFMVVTGSGGRVGGTTEELVVGTDVYGKKTEGRKRYSQCEFKYTVWYMDGDGYDGNWIATMETWDHDWWNGGSTDFLNVYIWYDYNEVEAPEFEMKYDSKWHYTRLPYQAPQGWVYSGYTGYLEDDGTSSYGWYYEQGRNNDGTWSYVPVPIWDNYYKEFWQARNTGSNFQNTQTVSTRRMESPRSITLIYYIAVIGYWGGRTNYSWSTVLHLQDPAGDIP